MRVLFPLYNLILFKIRKFFCSERFGSLFSVFSFVLLSLFCFNSFLVSSLGLFSVAFSCIFIVLYLYYFCSVVCFVFIFVLSLFSLGNNEHTEKN